MALATSEAVVGVRGALRAHDVERDRRVAVLLDPVVRRVRGAVLDESGCDRVGRPAKDHHVLREPGEGSRVVANEVEAENDPAIFGFEQVLDQLEEGCVGLYAHEQVFAKFGEANVG